MRSDHLPLGSRKQRIEPSQENYQTQKAACVGLACRLDIVGVLDAFVLVVLIVLPLLLCFVSVRSVVNINRAVVFAQARRRSS
jgi:hypothetical protein